MSTSASSKRSPLKFFLLVFALTIPFWLISAAAEQGLPLPIKLPVSALAFVCPLIAALILVSGEEGRGGVSRLLQRVFDQNRIRPKIWYVPIIFLMPIMVWLYNNAGKSLFGAILFHAMVNVSEFSFPNYGSHYDPAIAAAITAVIVVIVTFLWGPKTLARYRYGPRSRL